MARGAYKAQWQREDRKKFRERYGYSKMAHYATDGLREQVLERDGRRCVRCGMTEDQHRARWNRPITVDHKDKNRANNTLENLQTLCLTCHGRKDLIARLREPRVLKFQSEILAARAAGRPYQAIADEFGFSIAAIWKWCKRWGESLDSRQGG